MKTFEIYFSDLTEKSQKALCAEFETTGMEENWEVYPLATIERADEEDS